MTLILPLLAAAAALSGSAKAVEQPSCASETKLKWAAGPVRLAYVDHGPATGKPMILVGGTDQQLIDWPPALIKGLQSLRVRPIVYDARDVGCSAISGQLIAPDWTAFFAALSSGRRPTLAYSQDDLSSDLVRLADTLGLKQFHLLSASGGSATVAPIAAAQRTRVLSLILVMPGSGSPAIKIPALPERLATLPPMPASTAGGDTVLNYRVALSHALEGSKLRRGEDQIRADALAATKRSWNPDAIARTGAATLAAGDLRPTFARVRVPTVVLHGSEDPLLSPEHGQSIASAIPGARFELIDGLGHSLPPNAVPHVLKAVKQVLAQTSEKAQP